MSKKLVWRNKDIKYAISLYNSGISINGLAKTYGLSFGAMRKMLKSNGVLFRSQSEACKLNWALSNAQEKEIVSLYQSGLGFREILEIKQHGTQTISRVLKKHRVVLRKPGKKYDVNEQYFNTINEESAYWLGFILADGCIIKGRVLQVSLKCGDERHLRKLNKALSSNYPIKTVFCSKGHQQAKLSISSKNLCESLMKIGVCERKSGKEQLLPIGESNIRHFWRGVFDGDGWIFKDKKRNQWHVGICGSYEIVSAFLDFARNNVGGIIENKTIGTIGKIRTLNFVGRPLPYKVTRIMYSNNNICLDRKSEKYLKLSKEVEES